MTHLDLQQARRLRDAFTPLYHHAPPPAVLLGHLADAVNELIGADMTCFDIFNEAGRMDQLGQSSHSLFTPELVRHLADHIHTHPLFPGLFVERTDTPLKITDFCSSAKFRKTNIFNDFYRLVNVQHQLITGFEVPGLGYVTCALSRSRHDFTETERTLLAFAQPHLVLLLERAAQAGGPGLAAGAPHLTPREAAILRCLAQGQPDKAIAHHCGISPRTVQVHLRNIYAKLGVDNRTAAALAFNN